MAWRAISHLSLNYLSLVNSTPQRRRRGAARAARAVCAERRRRRAEAGRGRARDRGRAGRAPAADARPAGVRPRPRDHASTVDEMAFEGASAYPARRRARSTTSRATCRSTRSPKPSCARRAGARSADGCRSGARDRRCSLPRRVGERAVRYDFYQTLRRLECLYRRQAALGRGAAPGRRTGAARTGSGSVVCAGAARVVRRRPGRPGRRGCRCGCSGCSDRTDRCRFTSPNTRASGCAMPATRRSAAFSTSFTIASSRCSIARGRRRSRTSTAIARTSTASRLRRRRSLASRRRRFATATRVPDVAKLFHVGALVRHVRNAEGLAAILEQFFRVPVRDRRVRRPLDGARRARAHASRSRERGRSGAGRVLGRRVWDRQHKFRVRLGPLTLRAIRELSSGPQRGSREAPTMAVAAQAGGLGAFYFSFELDWDVRLMLEHSRGAAADARPRRATRMDDMARHAPERTSG